MKKKFFTLCFALLFWGTIDKVTAQETNVNINAIETSTAHLKNHTVTIEGLKFDYRILKHYSESELRSLSEIKRKQVHTIYTESYTVLNLSDCSSLKESDIDVSKIETLRKDNEDNIVPYGTDCKVNIKLISKNALDLKLQEIK